MKLSINKLIGLLLGLLLLFPAQVHAEAVEVQVSGIVVNPWYKATRGPLWALSPGLGGGYDFRAPASRAQGWSWTPSLMVSTGRSLTGINLLFLLPVVARYRYSFHQQFSVDFNMGILQAISSNSLTGPPYRIMPLIGFNLNYTFENKMMAGISILGPLQSRSGSIFGLDIIVFPSFNISFSFPIGVSEAPASLE